MRQVITFTFCAALLLPALCLAGEKVEIKLEYHSGEAWQITEHMEMDQTTTMNSAGSQKTYHDKQMVNLSIVRTTLEAQDGLPKKVRLEFDEKCEATANQDGKELGGRHPLAGKTVTLTIKTDQSVETDPPMALGAIGAQLMSYAISSQRELFPDHPVGPGDSWTVKPEDCKMLQQIPVKGTIAGGITCTLDRIADRDGRRVAELTMKTAISGAMSKGGVMTMNYTGPWVVDLATGETLLLETSGEVKTESTEGEVAADGKRVSGLGVTKTTYTAKPLKAVPTAPAGKPK